MNGFAIRSARIEDAQAVGVIYAHHALKGTATFDTLPPTTELWVEVGRLHGVGLKFGRYLDSVYMQRELTA